MGANCLKVFDDLLDIGETLLCGVDKVTDGEARRLAVELAHGIASIRLQLRELSHNMLKVLFEALDCRLGFSALGFRRGGTPVDRLSLAERSECKAHRRAQDADVVGGGFVVQGREGFGLLGLKGLIDGAPPRLVVLAFKYCGQRCFQIVDQPAHDFAELGGSPAPAIRWLPASAHP